MWNRFKQLNGGVSWSTEVNSGAPQSKLKTMIQLLIICSKYSAPHLLYLYCHQWFVKCFLFLPSGTSRNLSGFCFMKNVGCLYVLVCAFQNASVHMKVTLQSLYLKGISLGWDLSKCRPWLRQLSWWDVLFCHACEWWWTFLWMWLFVFLGRPKGKVLGRIWSALCCSP